MLYLYGQFSREITVSDNVLRRFSHCKNERLFTIYTHIVGIRHLFANIEI